MKKGVLIGGLLCLVLIGAALVAVFLQPIVVQGAAVTRGDLLKTESLLGQYIPHERQNVLSTRSGKVGRVAIAEGDTISAGDTVITLSAEELTAELNAVETALRNLENSSKPVIVDNDPEAEAAKAALSAALSNMESAQTLAQTVGIEYSLFNDAIVTYLEASARAVFSQGTGVAATGQKKPVDEAERQRLLGWKEEISAQLAALDVISTVSGNVLWVNVETGAEVKEGDVLAIAGNARGGMVSAMDADGKLKVDDEVTLVCNGLNWKGKVAEKDGNVAYIKPETGFMANGDITVVATLQSEMDVCLLPVECLGEDNDGEYVLILNDEGVLERRNVTTSLEQGGMVAVTSGVGIGETAIYYPDRYSAGMRAELYS